MKWLYRIASIPLVIVVVGHLGLGIAIDEIRCRRVRPAR